MANKGIIFYDDWCDMVNQYYDSGDAEAAYQLTFAIIRLYSTGELIKLPRCDLDIMLQYTIKSGLDTQVKHYNNGTTGGRPKKLSDEDQLKIAELRSQGYTAKEVADVFKIGEATVRRAEGWKNYQNLSYHNIKSSQNIMSYQNQNQEEEEEKEEEKEIRYDRLKDVNDFPATRLDMSDEDCDTCNDFELDEDMGWGVSDDKFDEFARKHGMTVDRLYKLLTYAQSQNKYPGW